MEKDRGRRFTPLNCCGGCAAVSIALVCMLFVLVFQIDGKSGIKRERNVFIRAIEKTNEPKELAKYLFQSDEAARVVVEKMAQMDNAECDYLLVGTEHMSDEAYSLVSSKISSEPLRFLEPMKRAISSGNSGDHRRWLLNEIALLDQQKSNDYLLELVKGKDKDKDKDKDKELEQDAVSAIARCGSPKLFAQISALNEKDENIKKLAQLVELRKSLGNAIGNKVFDIEQKRAFFHKIDGVLAIAREHPDEIEKIFEYLEKKDDGAIETGVAIARMRRQDEKAFHTYFAAREKRSFHASRLDKEYFENAQNLKKQLLALLSKPSEKDRKKQLWALYGLVKTDTKDVDRYFEKFILAKKDEWAEKAMEHLAKEAKDNSAPLFRRLIAKSYCKYKALSLLVDVGEQKDFKLYKPFLKHDNFRYRVLAQFAYGRFGTQKEQDEAMLLAFHDSKHQVNFAAVSSMDRTTAPTIRDELKKLAKEGKHLHQRLYAAEVIGRAHKREDLPLLVNALKDRYELLSEKEMSLTVLSLGTYWLAKKFLTDSPERGCRIARRKIGDHLKAITSKDYGTNAIKWQKWLAENR